MNDNPSANNDDDRAAQDEAGRRDAAAEERAESGERASPPSGSVQNVASLTWTSMSGAASRIAFRIYGAFVILVIATILAGIVGWFSLDNVGAIQDRINDTEVPAMTAAFGIAQNANTLVAAGPKLVATTNPGDYQAVSDEAAASHQALVSALALLQGKNVGDDRFGRMRTHVDTLISNTHAIQQGMVQSFPRTVRLDEMRHEIDDLSFELNGLLKPAADDQFFYMATGFYNLEDPADDISQSMTESELNRYRILSALASDANSALQILESAFGVASPSALEPLRERFLSTMRRIRYNMGVLEGIGLEENSEYITFVREELSPLIEHLQLLGSVEEEIGAFGLLDKDFRVIEDRQELLDANRAVAVDLLNDVNVFVKLTDDNVESATTASDRAAFSAKFWLVLVIFVSIIGAAFMAWLFIRRFLLARLENLLGSMRRMAFGEIEDLQEIEIDTSGRDELAAMAYAVDVFRLNSIAAAELDEVRRLNEQLEVTNIELAEVVHQRETALTELSRAQDQIVARDKLAALGELTAGVAHEIRNPLNFVKNFSEGGVELVEELKELLEEAEEEGEDADMEYVAELADDLFSNFEFIISHSNRADSIVTGMLAMGRGSTEFHPANVNNLIDEYARLAFHSARAADPDFQLDMQWDLDENMVEIPVIAQDLSRVFVNIVSNSCYATNERRLAARAAGASATLSPDGYMPTLWLSTKLDGEHAEVRIRDNGGGIPDDVVEKIFNPFFTTKPTNEGTGLGLAMCTDIVRGHGGAITVETEPGEGTEMIIRIPVSRTDPDAITGDIS